MDSYVDILIIEQHIFQFQKDLGSTLLINLYSSEFFFQLNSELKKKGFFKRPMQFILNNLTGYRNEVLIDFLINETH